MRTPDFPPIPADESERLAALKSYCVLDTPPDPVFDQVTDLATRLLNVEISLISLLDENRQWFKSSKGLATNETPRHDSFCAYAIHDHRPMIVLDATADPRFVNNALVTGDPHIRFYAGAPLITSEGICLGTLCIIGKSPRTALSEEDEKTLVQLAALVMARLELLRATGYIDPLTRLPNRARFIEDLRFFGEGTSKLKQSVTVIVVDLCDRNYFVDMVKAFGWDYADEFLLEGKKRLVESLHATAIYRVDTTLFAYLHYSGEKILKQQVNDLIKQFRPPVEHCGIPYQITPTVAAIPLESGHDGDEIVRSMLTATDLAREEGCSFKCYDAKEGQRQKYAFDLLSALFKALSSQDQLELHFQPKIFLADGRCAGVEALIRWNHPTLGPISPAMFIPLAEKTTLIRGITQWAIRKAIEQQKAWLVRGIEIPIAINVSARDFENDELKTSLPRLVQDAKLPAHLIEIEFTESAIVSNHVKLTQSIQSLRGAGVKVSIDDFGSGFSNMTYLKSVPADCVKIDQSFVKGLIVDGADQMIVPAMIQLGHQLGYTVVAEGIECEKTLKLLRALGCDQGQGYFIAKPMKALDFEHWLRLRS